MKKSLIAASASAVALAAMPVVGVFAAPTNPLVTSQTDTINITINKVCSFGYDTDTSTTSSDIEVTGVTHTDGDGAWGSSATADTLSKVMINDSFTENLGKTTLGVYCNNENGYTITTTEASSLTDVATTNPVTDVIPISATFYTAGTPATITSGWSYKVAAGTANTQRGEVKNGHTNWAVATGTQGTDPIANDVIAGSKSGSSDTKITTNAGDFYTITYGVGIDNTQSAATYGGHIVYTLATL